MSDRDDYLTLIEDLHRLISQADRQQLEDLNLVKFELKALICRVSLRIKLNEMQEY